MARPMTEKEMDDILKNPSRKSLRGYADDIVSTKLDIYSSYLKSKFDKVDKMYSSVKLSNKNKGNKGELLMCGIIDLTMRRFGFYLGRHYKVIFQYNGRRKTKLPGIDFRLTCNNMIFLCEAKNFIHTEVNKDIYKRKIRKRFRFAGINVLMIHEDKIDDVKKYAQKYPPLNRQPINYLRISHFMDKKINIEETINDNLLWGVELLANLIYYNKGIKYVDKEYTLDECLWMGMPTWFICDYQDISEKTVHRQAKDFISIGKVKHIEN